MAISEVGPYRRCWTAVACAITILVGSLLLAPSAFGGVVIAPASIEAEPGLAVSVTIAVTIPDGADVEAVSATAVRQGADPSASWVVVAPEVTGPVSPPVDVPFTAVVTVPETAFGGRYLVTVRGFADGVDVGNATLEIIVSGDAPIELAGRFRERWRQSRLDGALIITGYVNQAATVVVTLRGRGPATRLIVRKVLRVARAGAVRSVVPLPANLVPGVYTFTYVGRGAEGAFVDRSVPLRLVGPPEGVVGKAWISRLRGGPPAIRLPRTTTRLWARFVFAAPPTRGPVTVWWERNGRRATPFKQFGYRRVFDDYTGNYAKLLPPGRWICVLRINGKVVRQAAVRVR